MRLKTKVFMVGAAALVAGFLLPAIPVRAQEDSPTARVSSNPIPDPDGVLATGDPPLTRRMVERYTNFVEWLFKTPFNQSQRQYIEGMLKRNWRENDRKAIGDATGTLDLASKLDEYPPDQREYLHQTLLPVVLENCRKEDNPDNRWILRLYDAAHKPIAPGDPPLTRQASDAFAEMLCFLLTEASGQTARADDNFKAKWAEAMAAQYPKMTPEARRNLADIPARWAGLRVAWAGTTDEQKKELRALWRKQLALLAPPSQRMTAEEEKAVAYLKTVLAQIRAGQKLTPTEYRVAADKMEVVARAERRIGGAENLESAADLEKLAKAYREAANRPATPPSTLTSGTAYNKAVSSLNAGHAAFVNMFNRNTISYAGTMNAINIMSGSPYRYTVH